jgi:DNA-binding NarL/FixJ family response regulator
MQEFIEQVSAARDPTAVGSLIAQATAKEIGWTSYAFFAVESGVRSRAHQVLASQIWPTDGVDYPEMVRVMDREFGGLEKLLAQAPGAFNLEEYHPIASLRGTELVERYWRPWKAMRQICAPLRFQGQPFGNCALVRGDDEPAFTDADLRALEAIRIEAERTIAATLVLGDESADGTLAVLTAAFPLPAYLFDAKGRMQWASEEGTLRLGLEALRLGSGCLVRDNEALAQLTAAARTALADPSVDPDVQLRRAGLLGPGERVVSRRFDESGHTTLLLAIASAAAAALPGVRGDSPGRVPGLGASESAVARLAAEGFSVLNISARLGIAETTVKTHLRRLYVKLGVHSRAELASVLFRGRK